MPTDSNKFFITNIAFGNNNTITFTRRAQKSFDLLFDELFPAAYTDGADVVHHCFSFVKAGRDGLNHFVKICGGSFSDMVGFDFSLQCFVYQLNSKNYLDEPFAGSFDVLNLEDLDFVDHYVVNADGTITKNGEPLVFTKYELARFTNFKTYEMLNSNNSY